MSDHDFQCKYIFDYAVIYTVADAETPDEAERVGLRWLDESGIEIPSDYRFEYEIMGAYSDHPAECELCQQEGVA